MKESKNFFSKEEIKSALSKMHDAIGVNYTDFGDVMETIDDMRLDIRPSLEVIKTIREFKTQKENHSEMSNPVDFWMSKSHECKTVIEAVKLYWEANRQQFPHAEVIKNRAIFLANKNQWK